MNFCDFLPPAGIISACKSPPLKHMTKLIFPLLLYINPSICSEKVSEGPFMQRGPPPKYAELRLEKAQEMTLAIQIRYCINWENRQKWQNSFEEKQNKQSWWKKNMRKGGRTRVKPAVKSVRPPVTWRLQTWLRAVREDFLFGSESSNCSTLITDLDGFCLFYSLPLQKKNKFLSL